MAVQKSRRAHRHKSNRRAHDKLTKATLSEDSTTGETHLRHHVTQDGFYRGQRVVARVVEEIEEEIEEA